MSFSPTSYSVRLPYSYDTVICFTMQRSGDQEGTSCMSKGAAVYKVFKKEGFDFNSRDSDLMDTAEAK